MESVRTMLPASPEPHSDEHTIHDHEGFEGASLSEYASFETACDLADFVEEHGELGAKLFSHFGDDLAEARAADMELNAEVFTIEVGFDPAHVFGI